MERHSLKISFVIPAYNEEAYIYKCLQSIFKEIKKGSYNVEIIVVNNSSTDKTRDIAQSFPNVIVIDEPHKGVTWARQAGFLVSSGDVIVQLDADTMLPEGWIEKAMEEFRRDPNLVALSSGLIIFYDLPKVTNSLVHLYYYFAYILYLLNRFVLNTGSMLQGANAIIRRTALKEINGYNMNYNFYGEDTDLARRLHKVGKVKFTLKFPTYTSGRRLAKEGIIIMGSKYALNYIWAIFLKKPFTKNFRDISQKNV